MKLVDTERVAEARHLSDWKSASLELDDVHCERLRLQVLGVNAGFVELIERGAVGPAHEQALELPAWDVEGISRIAHAEKQHQQRAGAKRELSSEETILTKPSF